MNNYFFCFINIIFHYLLYFSRNSSPLALSDILFLDYIVNGEDMHELDEKISLFFSKKLEITRDQVSRDYANLRTRTSDSLRFFLQIAMQYTVSKKTRKCRACLARPYWYCSKNYSIAAVGSEQICLLLTQQLSLAFEFTNFILAFRNGVIYA